MDGTRLSVRGYSLQKHCLSPEALNELRNELTMTPCVSPMMSGGPTPSFPVYAESESKIYVPKYFGLRKFGLPKKDVVPHGAPMRPEVCFRGALRPEQGAPVDTFLRAAADPMRRGGILSLPCGGGKTVVALHLIATLARKTLIIVHKDFLLHQWKERISQFLPDASIGLIKAKTIDVVGKDIVIGSLQSLSMKEYSDDVFADFGMLVVDECHRVGTEVFSRALFRTNFRVTLGLSATVRRKDGLTKAFVAFLGDVLYSSKRNKNEVVNVVQHCFFDEDPRYGREETMAFGKINVARMTNNICAWEPRSRWIVEAVAKVVAAEPLRKILVLSDRKSQLSWIKSTIESAFGLSAGFYWGGMKPDALAESEKKQVMCATFAYAAEGMDVPDLDTLVLASPKSDIEQSCGRILRQKPEDRRHTPLILDVVDDFSIFGRQGKKRRDFFKKHGYRIHDDLSHVVSSSHSDDSDSDSDASGYLFCEDT